MTENRNALTASLLVVSSGILWGFYWLPVRSLETMGLSGAWGTAAITLCAVLVMLVFTLLRGSRLRTRSYAGIFWVGLGGASFALYSIGFVYGRVAIIILLFFLTPVWSTLIGRVVLGWHTPLMRVLAIVAGLAGLGVMLGAGGEAPVPRNIGEWMALVSGIMWSVATTGMRVQTDLEPAEATFVFVVGAFCAALPIAFLLDPLPTAIPFRDAASVAGLALLTGALWWSLFVVGLMWATVRLEPARAGILFMSEVLVGAASAAVIAGEYLSALEVTGGVLVLLAGVLEIQPWRRTSSATDL
ncbi:DMT family transporter [uncultured Roseobacter sp.]|uniref:DMT family transporter n=1 Tax=uncultured Roseobacter sp. TaxID=114847 RepID=UPI00260CF558|nr:DMT family transporter [uncultured Roseobacter sp.]